MRRSKPNVRKKTEDGGRGRDARGGRSPHAGECNEGARPDDPLADDTLFTRPQGCARLSVVAPDPSEALRSPVSSNQNAVESDARSDSNRSRKGPAGRNRGRGPSRRRRRLARARRPRHGPSGTTHIAYTCAKHQVRLRAHARRGADRCHVIRAAANTAAIPPRPRPAAQSRHTRSVRDDSSPYVEPNASGLSRSDRRRSSRKDPSRFHAASGYAPTRPDGRRPAPRVPRLWTDPAGGAGSSALAAPAPSATRSASSQSLPVRAR